MILTDFNSLASRNACDRRRCALSCMRVFWDLVASSKFVTALIVSPASHNDSAKSNTASLFAPLLIFTESVRFFFEISKYCKIFQFMWLYHNNVKFLVQTGGLCEKIYSIKRYYEIVWENRNFFKIPWLSQYPQLTYLPISM